MSPYNPSRGQYRYRQGLLSTAQLALMVVVVGGIIAALMFWLASCEDSDTAAFTQRCLAAHPDAHVSVESHSAYKSYSITRYCLGPQGQLWIVG